MMSAETALKLLRLTGWNSERVAKEFDVCDKNARMFLNGERNIPEKYRSKIPVEIFTGDTHEESRTKKEQKINELKKFSIPVPFK